MFVGGGCRLEWWVYCKDGGFVILGVTSPKLPAEGRLRPPDPLQMGVRVCWGLSNSMFNNVGCADPFAFFVVVTDQALAFILLHKPVHLDEKRLPMGDV
jgi:hypothetical protein